MLTLRSPSFADGQEIPARHGKRGQNLSPALEWADPPPGTSSFALAVVDTDPVAQGFVHWLVTDIEPAVAELSEGDLPAGSHEVRPYAGPFPPSGTHDYEFTLYALDTASVEVPEGASLDEFLDVVEPHAIASANLVGTFTR
jgi:Raf kinase inhibitor-like YbhB/YbcL family protein